MDKKTYEAALENTHKALDYYTTIFAKPNQAARIRSESAALTGLLAYKGYLETILGVIDAPVKKRGNPNFGKSNPWNEQQKAEAAAKALEEKANG